MTANLSTRNQRHIAFFAGTFNPFTVGHASVVERALAMFDEVIIGVGVNLLKTSAVEAEQRASAVARLYESEPRVSVRTYDGLTTDAALEAHASCLLRGVRSAKDFEYERDMADMNRRLSGLDTVLLYSLPEHAAISSSVVRELQQFGKKIDEFLPTK